MKTGLSLNDSEQPNLRQQRRSTRLYHLHRAGSDILHIEDEEIQICQHLISLLVDNQPMTPSLNTACEWYRQYLKNNIINYWPLIQSALKGVKRSSKSPSREDFAIAISFVHEVASQLVTEEKDIALCEIVDELVNAKIFKPELDEDRIIPNQLVFTVIGWLRKSPHLCIFRAG